MKNRKSINISLLNNIVVKTILFCFRFKEKATELSAIFHDQPLKSLQKAVYWIEYVLRHNGAHHLKTAGSQLTWYEFLLLDGLFLMVVVRIIVTAIMWYVGKKLWNKFWNRKSKKD